MFLNSESTEMFLFFLFFNLRDVVSADICCEVRHLNSNFVFAFIPRMRITTVMVVTISVTSVMPFLVYLDPNLKNTRKK